MRARAPAIAGFLLPFTLVVYLGLRGGGYDLVTYSEVGIVIWWAILLAGAVAVLPASSIPKAGWLGLGLLAALAIWTTLGIGWSESAERSLADAGRIVTYLGVFALALATTGREGLRRMVNAVAAAIVVIGVLALLSRLHPSWFPTDRTAIGLQEAKARLNYPLNYWNGLAAIIAMGIPLVLVAAHRARSVVLEALAVASIPAIALAGFYTISRGGVIELFVALGVLLALYPRRLAILPSLALASVGSAVLMLVAAQRDALQDGLSNAIANDQRDEMLVIAIVVCALVGLAQVGVRLAARRGAGWRVDVAPHRAAIAVGAAIVVVCALAIAAGAPGKISDRWEEFKQPVDPGSGPARIESAAGNGRYQVWQSALDANETEPLVGIGPGTFEFWWAREGTVALFIQDAHSLYFESLAEIGIVGLLLVLGLLGTTLVAGLRLTRAAIGEAGRGYAAAAVAAVATFAVGAAYDWIWDLPAIGITTLLLAAAILGTRRDPLPEAAGEDAHVYEDEPTDEHHYADEDDYADDDDDELADEDEDEHPDTEHERVHDREADAEPERPRKPVGPRIAIALVAVAALIVIAIPMAMTSLVRSSQEEVRSRNLDAALDDARTAHDVEPFAATPLLQEALVQELRGDFTAAAAAAREATEKESTNWRNWLALSRLEARAGNIQASIAAYRRARSLNPRSPIFD